MEEWEIQKTLYEILTEQGYPCYTDKGRPSAGWKPKTFGGDKKRPDLIFTHKNLRFLETKTMTLKQLPSPIGVEINIADKFNHITRGIIDQIQQRYSELTYTIDEQKWEGQLPIILFATDKSLLTGFVDTPSNWDGNTINRVIERFLWRIGHGLMIRTEIIHQKEFEEGGQYSHIFKHGKFDRPTISISYDNNLIKLLDV